jgi:hypothetical protein
MTDGTPTTLRELLPKELDGLEAAIEDGLRRDANGSLSTLAWRFVRSSAAEEVDKALDADAWRVLARAWAKASELHTHANSPPGETRVVHLGNHDFRTAVHPELTVDVGTPPYPPPLVFTLEIATHIQAATLRIKQGRIVALEAGDAWVYAELKHGKTRMHKEESRMLQLPGEWTFDPGIQIEPDREQPRG